MAKRLRAALIVIALVVVGLAVPGGSAPEDPVTTFSAAGDFGSGNSSQAVLSKIGELGRDAHFALGDLSYGPTGNEQAWCDLVTDRVGAGFPFELLAGNHESNGQNGNINDFAACLPNQLPGAVGTYGRQYYVDVPADAPLVRYVMISPGVPYTSGTWSYAAGTPRYAWTAQAIDGARAAGVPWVVVGMHMPCLSVGEYGCVSGSDIMNLMADRDVDLVLTGHEHLYQRSKQLSLNTSCPAITPGTYDADCVADADDDLAKGAGTVFTTVGTGGVEIRDVHTDDTEMPYFAATSGGGQNPTFGTLDVSVTADVLTAAFVRAAGGTFTDAFTITRPDPNATTTTEATTTTTEATTTTTEAPPTFVVDDQFDRTVSNGLGVAPTGGPWTPSGPAANFSVSGGRGQIVMPSAGSGRSAYLNSVSSESTDLRTVISTDKPGGGSGLYVSVLGRQVPGAGDYRAKLRIQSTGSVLASLSRMSSTNAETSIGGAVAVPGYTQTPGNELAVRLEVTGTSPTTIRLKAWPAGTAEPVGWTVTATDSTAGLQTAGSIGFSLYLSGSAANAPITMSIDSLTVPVA